MDTKLKEATSLNIIELVEIIELLRSNNGCAWDKKQTHNTLSKHLLEEANEVIEAIESGDFLSIKEELGDLLMIIVLNSQIATEKGTFNFAEVCNGISEKLKRRHEHIFKTYDATVTAEEVTKIWNKVKSKEKEAKSKISVRLNEILKAPSAVQAALGLQKEAAKVGFEFSSPLHALDKVFEEASELKSAIQKQSKEQIECEVGDLFFSVLNIARLLNVDVENVLSKTSQKFVDRITLIEEISDKDLAQQTEEELDNHWNKAKKIIKKRDKRTKN